MNTMKIIFCITAILLLTTSQVISIQAGNQNPLDSEIMEMVNNLANKLPRIIVKGIKTDKILFHNSEIHIRRNFKNFSAKRAKREIIKNERSEIINACCSNITIRNSINNGIALYFDYYGKNGMYIASTAVDADDCRRQSSTRDANIINRDGVYILYANGIVKDTSTGLEWVTGPDKNITWGEANSWVKRLSLSGGGWRMPTLVELESLYKKGAGPRNMTPLLKTKGWWVWSGETVGSREARSFSFGTGFKGWIFRRNSASERVFAVRSRGLSKK